MNLTFNDLVIPTKDTLHKCFSELIDKVVAQDGNVTRREEQLDQLCEQALIFCPGDIKEEIDAIQKVAEEFNDAYSDVLGISIRTKHWSKNSYPQS